MASRLDHIEQTINALAELVKSYHGDDANRVVVELLAAMADNRALDAIRIYRALTKTPLKESKDIVLNAMSARGRP